MFPSQLVLTTSKEEDDFTITVLKKLNVMHCLEPGGAEKNDDLGRREIITVRG
jgi:hypothetical protein